MRASSSAEKQVGLEAAKQLHERKQHSSACIGSSHACRDPTSVKLWPMITLVMAIRVLHAFLNAGGSLQKANQVKFSCCSNGLSLSVP